MLLWIKAFHIIAMVAWFAGLFYLPRLFVYHCSANSDDDYQRFCVMERRLYKAIMWPALLITLVLGLGLMHLERLSSPIPLWLTYKLVLVLVLVIFHHYCGYQIKQFQRQQVRHTQTFYRWLNEIPTVLLISIVLLVVLKPL